MAKENSLNIWIFILFGLICTGTIIFSNEIMKLDDRIEFLNSVISEQPCTCNLEERISSLDYRANSLERKIDIAYDRTNSYHDECIFNGTIGVRDKNETVYGCVKYTLVKDRGTI